MTIGGDPPDLPISKGILGYGGIHIVFSYEE